MALGGFLLLGVWIVLSVGTSGGIAWPLGIDAVTVLGFYGLIVGGLWVIRIARAPGET